MRHQGCWRSVRWAPGFLPTISHGLLSERGRAERTLTAAPESGTMRAPVLLRRSLISAASRAGEIGLDVAFLRTDVVDLPELVTESFKLV